MKTIKLVETSRYSVGIKQTDTGEYIVTYSGKSDGYAVNIEPLKDYAIASYLFDIKLQEFEITQ